MRTFVGSLLIFVSYFGIARAQAQTTVPTLIIYEGCGQVNVFRRHGPLIFSTRPHGTGHLWLFELEDVVMGSPDLHRDAAAIIHILSKNVGSEVCLRGGWYRTGIQTVKFVPQALLSQPKRTGR